MKKKWTKWLLKRLLTVGLIFWATAVIMASIPAEERNALIALYNATNGDNWRNNHGWRKEPLELDDFGLRGREHNWRGVTVKNNHVTEIELSSNHVIGTLPPELGNLRYLESLVIVGLLEGDIPREIYSLDQLRKLHIRGKFNSSLPPDLGRLTNLRILWLSGEFEGPIPQEIGNLARLQELSLSSGFSGVIPPEVGNLTALQFLSLEGDFSGGIPPELGNLFNLKELKILSDNILGRKADLESYKEELNRLKGKERKQFMMEQFRSQLTGSLPIELGKLTNLEELTISGNLTGGIPTELGNLTFLKKLNLRGNRLQGFIPLELGKLTQLEDLGLSGNLLSGSIPPELGNLTKLKFLWLSKNNLDGAIPPELGNLRQLQQLMLDGNQFSGEIPVNLSSLSAYLIKINYNTLYTGDDMLKRVLNRSDLSWSRTQTVAPTNIKAEPTGEKSVTVSWKPIRYQEDAGGYLVYYSDSPGGPWMLAGQTRVKSRNSFQVTGLNRGFRYYFTVQTRTLPHRDNPNTLTSDYSSNAEAILE